MTAIDRTIEENLINIENGALEGQTVNMIPVSSSAISYIGYEPTTAQMAIRFKQGKIYNFCRVPECVFEAFLSAPSKGTYYTDHIRGRYQC